MNTFVKTMKVLLPFGALASLLPGAYSFSRHFAAPNCSPLLLTGSTSSARKPSVLNLNMSLNDNNKGGDGSNDGNDLSASENGNIGKLEKLKQREAELSRLLSAIRQDKLEVLRERPLTIGVVGFGRFGQFIARTFAKHGKVVVTSRSDYTDIAKGMGVTYTPMSEMDAFVEQDLDVIVLAVSIVSFEDTVKSIAPFLQRQIKKSKNSSSSTYKAPLIVDVLSVKEHPRKILLDFLPKECDVLCTHPMFGPDSGKNGWNNLNFVFERTRIDGMVLDPSWQVSRQRRRHLNVGTLALVGNSAANDSELHDPSSGVIDDAQGQARALHEHSESHIEGMDRMERFLSIWEEEECRMVPLSCKAHDEYAASSQFITHLMGRILGAQGLSQTPIDTKGFESVLKLIGSTTADSFDLFYGLYKYNKNSLDIITSLQAAMDDVVKNLKEMEADDE
jgi:arogenate dehydrogenase (NADP+)